MAEICSSPLTPQGVGWGELGDKGEGRGGGKRLVVAADLLNTCILLAVLNQKCKQKTL